MASTKIRPRQRVVASHHAMGRPNRSRSTAVQAESRALSAMEVQSMSFPRKSVAGKDRSRFGSGQKSAKRFGGVRVLRTRHYNGTLPQGRRYLKIASLVAHRWGEDQ